MDVEADVSMGHGVSLFVDFLDIVGNHFFERDALAATLRSDRALFYDVSANSKNAVC